MLFKLAKDTDLSCNLRKTVSMVFSPINPNKIVAKVFPQFLVGGVLTESVSCFRYLGYIIINNLSDDDIRREIVYVICLCVRTFCFGNFTIVPPVLREYCLIHIVFACMMLLFGLSTSLSLLISFVRVITDV